VAIEATIRREGKVTLFVRQDIILSREGIRSSARNGFRGRVVGISDLGYTTKLTVDAGRGFVAHITKRSLQKMQLNNGSEVSLAFKATSVQVV